MCEIGHHSTSRITLNVSSEVIDPDFLRNGVISTKLRRLIPFSGRFSLRMREVGHNSTSSVVSNVTNVPDFLKDGLISPKLRRLASVLADFHFF
jgi:hypothetical protein